MPMPGSANPGPAGRSQTGTSEPVSREPVSKDRWTKIENLFMAAAELPIEDRSSFLERECGQDDALRDEVASLLSYDTHEPCVTEVIQDAAAGVVSDAIVTDTLLGGATLGPWRVEREIGRGGMSVVYLAFRADGEFSKKAAVKVIKRGMDTASVIERLRRERRILAALDHPLIARLLDGGTTREGLPYLVMDYVEGQPIDESCDQRGLSVEERCRLMAQVCDAVAYAHRMLVIHRDLKPGNILVTEDGVPKLLDFGIAKLIADDPETGAADTRLARALTPEYASPEQIAGAAVGTATDVYSLGVVLFELLTGRRPTGETDRASAAARRAGKPERWAKQLEGDLDTILQMALRVEPERRYAGAGRFAEDLRRHLDRLPVMARGDSLAYRCAKFVRRHRVGTAAAALITLAGAAGAIVVVQAERKAEQRLSQMVELANTALFQVHGAIEHLPGATKARLEIVKSTLQYLDRLNAESGSDVRVLAALASAYARVGSVQGSPLQPNLGDVRGAQQSYIKAAKIFDSLRSAREDSGVRLSDAEFRDAYGRLLNELNRKDDAIAQYESGLAQTGVVLSLDAHNATARKLRAILYLERGQIAKYRDPVGTRRGDMEFLPFTEALVHDYPRDPECLTELADLWSQIGSTYEQQMNLRAATEAFRRSSALREQLIALEPHDVSVQRALLIAWGHLGDLTGSPMFPSVGDYAEAIVLYRQAAAMAHQMALTDPSSAQARNDEGTALLRVGASQMAAGRNNEGVQALARAESLLSAQSSDNVISERLALIYEFQGRTYAALNETSRAVDALRHSLAACKTVPKEHQSPTCKHTVWMDDVVLAPVLTSTGDAAGGLKLARTVLEEASHADSSDSVLPAYRARALQANAAVHAILAKQGDARGTERGLAADYYHQALAVWASFPQHSLAPFADEMRQAEAELAQVERR